MQEPKTVDEALGIACNASDLSTRLYECAADRIGSMAFGDPLGASLHRCRDGGAGRFFHESLRILQKRVINYASRKNWQKAPWDKLKLMSKIALQEWLFDVCPKCLGTGMITNAYQGANKLEERPCVCNHGKVSGSAVERARALGMDLIEYHLWEPRFRDTIQLINIAYMRTANTSKLQLEWVRGLTSPRNLTFNRGLTSEKLMVK